MEHEIYESLYVDRVPGEEQILDFYNSSFPDREIPGAEEVLSIHTCRPVNPKTGKVIRQIEIRILRDDGRTAEIIFTCLEDSVVAEERNLVL